MGGGNFGSYDNDDVIIKFADGTAVPRGQQTAANSVPVVLPSDVTVSTTQNVQTYATNNELYSFGIDINMATSSTDNPLVLFKNPTGSGKKIYFFKQSCGVDVTNVSAEFKLFHSPTVTANGSTITASHRNINNGQAASAITAFSLPTVSASGTYLENLVIGQNTNSYPFANEFSIVLQPNSTLLLTGSPSSNNRIASITFIWAEL